MKEAEFTSEEVFAYETALPTGQWSSYGEGILPERSDQDMVSEGMGSLDALCRTNYKMMRNSADPEAVRTQEDMRFIKGMSHTIIGCVLYGNASINPKQFTGLTPRYNSKAKNTVLSEGGSGSDLLSIWIVNWNTSDGAYIFYPKGRNDLGIGITNLGIGHATDTNNGGEYASYRTFFDIEWGLAVKREDQCCRYGDIESSGSTNTFDHKKMIEALNLLWEPQGSVIYGNRNALTQIDLLSVDKTNVRYYEENVYGRPTHFFQSHPIKLVEQLLTTESALAA